MCVLRVGATALVVILSVGLVYPTSPHWWIPCIVFAIGLIWALHITLPYEKRGLPSPWYRVELLFFLLVIANLLRYYRAYHM